jgi:uncharacterized membrane protein
MADEETKKESKTESKTKKASDDNIIAALSHALLIILPILAPLGIWLMYKDKSKYVKFQSFQAMIYQLAGSVVLFILSFIAIILSFIVIGILLFPVIFILMLAFAVYGIYGAYKCYQGEDFKYKVIGDLAEKHMK